MKKIIFLLALAFFSCEKEITNLQTAKLSNALVVYGEISNLKGPYTVRINEITAYSPYDIRNYIGNPVKNASVRIKDGLGNYYDLTEISAGYYQTSALFTAQENQTYQLVIKTTDGKTIESTIDKLKATPILKDFSFKFNDAEKVEDMYFEVKASIKDPSETTDYYFVKRQDFNQFFTTCPPPPPPPAPPPPCYFKCWAAPLNTQPVLVNDFLINGKNIPISMPNIDATDWSDRIIQLDVLSVSSEIYNYWQRQEDQRKVGGGLFDKIPAQIIGNLKCTSDANQQVLGVFVVSGTLKQRLIIKRYNEYSLATYVKVESYANNNNLRFPQTEILDCKNVGWIPYNIGYSIPDL